MHQENSNSFNFYIPEESFKLNIKKLVTSVLLLNFITIFTLFTLILILNYLATDKFLKEYREIELRNLSQILQNLDEIEQIKEIINEKSKQRWIKSIGIADNSGLIIICSNPEFINRRIDEFIKGHIWRFYPDGFPLPYEKYIKNELSVISTVPVYDKITKKIKFILFVKFNKFIIEPLIIFKKFRNYQYLFFAELFILLLIFSFLIATLIYFAYKNRYKKFKLGLENLIHELNRIIQTDFSSPINYNNKFKNTILGNYIDCINYVIEKNKEKLLKEKNEIKKIISTPLPLILKEDFNKEIKVYINKEKEENISSLIYRNCFNKENITSINGYSFSIYHFKKENPYIIFKQIKINSTENLFFIGELDELNENEKIFILSFINYFIEEFSKEIRVPLKNLLEMNFKLSNLNKNIKFNALFLLLDSSHNYLEIASSNISPVIFYNSGEQNFYFYNFESPAIGESKNEKLLEKLKTEKFKLNKDDIIFISNKTIENLKNFSGENYELNKIMKILKELQPASAEVLMDYIKNSIENFHTDFSKIKDFFMLILKNEKNE